MSATALRPRSATEIVDATFQLLRAHYVQLVTITAVLYAPLVILQLVLSAELLLVVLLVSVVTNALVTGTTILMVSDAYLGRQPDAAGALRATSRRLFTLTFTAIEQGLIISAGFILFLVPGFIFAAWAISMVPVVVLEKRGLRAAFGRSRELARGMVGHVLKALLLILVIYFAGVIVLGFVTASIGMEERNMNLASSLLGVLIAPLLGVGITLIYYDLRIRKEGFDLEMMAQNLDSGAPATTGAAPAASAV